MIPQHINIENNLIIRICKVSDAPDVYNLVDKHRNILRESLNWVDYQQSVEDSESYIRKCLVDYYSNKGFDYGIFLDNKIIGRIGAAKFDKDRKFVEIGYWLSPEYWGRGIVTKAVDKLSKVLLNDLGFVRIEIRTNPENHKSKAIPERLGFQFEGKLRAVYPLHGKFQDALVYAKVNEGAVG